MPAASLYHRSILRKWRLRRESTPANSNGTLSDGNVARALQNSVASADQVEIEQLETELGSIAVVESIYDFIDAIARGMRAKYNRPFRLQPEQSGVVRILIGTQMSHLLSVSHLARAIPTLRRKYGITDTVTDALLIEFSRRAGKTFAADVLVAAMLVNFPKWHGLIVNTGEPLMFEHVKNITQFIEAANCDPRGKFQTKITFSKNIHLLSAINMRTGTKATCMITSDVSKQNGKIRTISLFFSPSPTTTYYNNVAPDGCT